MSADNEATRDSVRRAVAVCDTLIALTQISYAEFAADIRSQWAVGMGFIQIGESVGRIPKNVLEQFPDQPWRQIIGMRNIAAHQYDILYPQRVWRTATVDVPALRKYLTEVVLSNLP